MFLIVGLGNPGAEYERNRHNIGFMAIDAIAEKYGFPPFKNKYKGLYAEGMIAGEKVALLKPQTYMNESGRSVGEVAKFYKIPTSDMIAFHDELDVAAGKLKIKIGGGAAGHNGLRSMDDWLDNPNYKRVRLGIGHPGDKDRVTGYVLGNFAKADEEWLEKLLPAIAKETPLLIKGNDADFLTNVARATQPPKPKKEKPNEELKAKE
ncbi:MAG TPA: aminoacyl-tRNA hydrolase [Alphaproteobacteria bacterium]|nr:aminoacyl-tRNA hydrolase [Alphaproteobacteria bacterium]HNS45466.1 aminoacyl-tRNA hydrolase [Alphaproteobacteria bacterium]